MDAPVPGMPPRDQIVRLLVLWHSDLGGKDMLRPAQWRERIYDNAELVKTRLTMPVLAVGGEKSFGANQATVVRNAASKVTEVVVPSDGHWLME